MLKHKFIKISSKNFKTKILFNFLITNVIIIIIMNIITFQYFDSYMKNEINTMSLTKLENINTVYSNHIEQYFHIATLIYTNPKISSFIYTSGNTSVLESIDISNYLRPILTTNEALNSLVLFNQENIIHEIDNQYIDHSLKQQILEQVLESKTDRFPLIIKFEDGSKKIIIFKSNRDTLYGKSQNGVFLIIDPETLQKNMFSNYENNPDEIFIVDNKNTNIIISQNDSYEFNHELLQDIINSGKTSDSFTENINYNRYIISYINNEKEDHSAISVIDYQSSLKELLRIRNIMIALTIVVSLFAFLLSYFLTNNIYKPINNILSNIQIAFKRPEQEDDQYDEIQKASMAINHAAFKINLLESKYNNNEIINYLRQGVNSSQQEFPKQITDLTEPLGRHYQYRIIITELDSDSSSDIFKEHSDFNLAESITAVCEQVFVKENNQMIYHVYNTEIDQAILIIIETQRNAQLNDIQIIEPFLKNILEKLIINYNISVSMGISNISNDISRILNYYSESQNLVKYQLFNGTNTIFAADTFIPVGLNEEQAVRISNNILELIKNDNIQEITLTHIHVLLDTVKNVEYEQSKKYLANLLINAKNLSRNMSVESKEYRNSYLDTYLKIQSCNNLNELTVLLQYIFNNACLELRIAKSKTIQINIIAALDYINRNFSDSSMSIDLLAERCNISSSYFSKLFKNYTNKTFPDYINQLRLQKAEEMLLKEKNTDINEISSAVGFNSNSYFAAAFKKRYGMSPSKYRMNKNSIHKNYEY